VGFSSWEQFTAQDQCTGVHVAVLPLDSGQCLFDLQVHICIARISAEMAAKTSSGPIDIGIE